MPFRDPIVSGTALVREAIQSPNYVPGVAGWSINRDGTAEFQGLVVSDGTITGGTIIAGTPGGERVEMGPTAQLAVYNGANQLVALVDVDGLGSYDPDSGGFAKLAPAADAAFLFLGPPLTGAVATVAPAEIFAQMHDPGTAAEVASVVVQSPSTGSGSGDRANVNVYGEDAAGGRPHIVYDATSTGTHQMIGSLDVSGAVTAGGRPVSWSPVGSATAAASSAAVAGETAVLTTGNIVWRTGRAYRIEVTGGVFSSAAGNLAYWRVRKTNAAGTIVREWYRSPTQGANVMELSLIGEVTNTTGADITAPACLTLQLSGGAGTVSMFGQANTPRTIRVFEVGAAADYPGASPIT